MIVNPVFGGAPYGFVPKGGPGTNGGGPRYFPKPSAGQFSWVDQLGSSSKTNVAQGLQLVSQVAGAGNDGTACIAAIVSPGSTFTISCQLFSTDINDGAGGSGAHQAYGSYLMMRDSTLGTSTLAFGISGVAGQPTGQLQLVRQGWKAMPGDNGANQQVKVFGLTSLPNILRVVFQGSVFSYFYGQTPGTLQSAGSDALSAVRAFDGFSGTWFPDQVGIIQVNQDGPPGFPGFNTTIFSGFQI